MSRLKLIYITSRGHSGSTLLDLLISSHPGVTSVGEIKCLSSAPNDHCTCGAMRIWECPFWNAVDATLYRATHLRLGDLDVESDDPVLFAAHNKALFEAVAAVTGRTVIVDSSKTVPRLRKLIDADIVDLTIIHLIRSPFGVVYSNCKRGRDWTYHARNYTLGMMRTRQLLDEREHLLVAYEDMARRTRAVIEPIMRRVSLNFEEAQLHWATAEHHNLGGNHMRFTTDSTIRLDEKWRKGLSPRQKLGVWWLTLPTRFGGNRFYERFKPLFDGRGLKPVIAKELTNTRKRASRIRRSIAGPMTGAQPPVADKPQSLRNASDSR